MPCNSTIHNYVTGGKERVVTAAGDVLAATIGVDPNKADGVGYISHFATCPRKGMFGKK